MTIKKMLLLASMALAAVAFAAPATASAATSHFVKNPSSKAIGVTGHPASFTGPVAFKIPGTDQGVHCDEIHFKLLVTTFHAHVTGVEFTKCTTTPDNFTVHPHAVDLSEWTAHPNVVNSTIEITNVHITNTVTGENEEVVGESTLTGGTVVATVPAGQTNTITTVTLSDIGASIHLLQPVPTGPFVADISGHLLSNGTIGIVTK